MYRGTSCRRTVTAGRSRACAVDLVFGVSAVASGGRRHPCGGIRPSVVSDRPESRGRPWPNEPSADGGVAWHR